MLFENLNYLLHERGAPPLSGEEFLRIDPEKLGDLIEELGYPFETLRNVNLEERAERLRQKEIKLIVLDVDGVLTDGGLYFSSAGEDSKKFDVKDGMAITKAIEKGMEFGIISASSRSEVVHIRSRILGIQNVYVGKTPKLEILESWLYEKGLGFENVAYVGDDINDVPILEKVGVSAAPADASMAAKKAADIVLSKPGGRGCVREFVEWIYPDLG